MLISLLTLALLGAPAPSWDALKPIQGSLLFACQSEPGTGDLYFKDDAGAVHRLTVTEPKQGAGEATWYGNRILAVIDRGFRNGLEIRSLTTRPDAVGKRLGEGISPAVSPTGVIAYVNFRRRTSGRPVEQIVRLRAGHRRVLWKYNEIDGLAWASRRRIVAFAQDRAGRATLVSITRRSVRSIRVGKIARTMALSRQRRVAISHGHDRLTIMRLDGSHRRTFRRHWFPWAWAPDGREILVSGRGRTIGLMNARTGKVRRLGALPCGYLTSAEWTRPGRHPWPGDPR